MTTMTLARPKRIILELTNKCNLRCIMCAQNHIAFDKTTLTLSMIEKIDPFLATAEEVTLFGYGEPLLNPEFPAILAHLKRYPNLKTYLLTNGVLLPKFVDLLMDHPLTYLSMSIDSATPETYRRIRRGGELSHILTALTRINEIKRQRGMTDPYLRFIFVMMRDNIKELPMLVALAKQYGVSEIKAEYLVAHSREMIEQSLFFHRDLLSIIDEAADAARTTGVKLSLPPAIGKDDSGDRTHRECTTPFDTLFLSSNGDIRACMISNELFGNIMNESAAAIWEGDRMNAYRARMNSADPPKDCLTCWQASHLNVNREDAHVRLDVTIAGQGGQKQ